MPNYNTEKTLRWLIRYLSSPPSSELSPISSPMSVVYLGGCISFLWNVGQKVSFRNDQQGEATLSFKGDGRIENLGQRERLQPSTTPGFHRPLGVLFLSIRKRIRSFQTASPPSLNPRRLSWGKRGTSHENKRQRDMSLLQLASGDRKRSGLGRPGPISKKTKY